MIIRNCYRVFVTNIRSILLYAIVGTILNFLIIGGCLVLKEVELFLDFSWTILVWSYTRVFQFCWPTAIVQMETNETTNVTTSQVETTQKIRSVTLNLVTTSQVESTRKIRSVTLNLFSDSPFCKSHLCSWSCGRARRFWRGHFLCLPFLCVWVWGGCLFCCLTLVWSCYKLTFALLSLQKKIKFLVQIGVNPDLYYLVFGESLLNDGVAVVLYDMMNIFVGMENAGETVTFGQVVNRSSFRHRNDNYF